MSDKTYCLDVSFANVGRLIGMAFKGTADERRASLRKGLEDAKHPKRKS